MNALLALLHILLAIGSFWLMGRADSKFVLFIMGMAFIAFAVVTIISPRQSKYIR